MNEVFDIARLQSRMGTVAGFAVMLLGVLAVISPHISGITVTTVIAVLIMAAGITMTVFAFKAESFGPGLLQFLFGGISVVAGAAVLMQPVIGMFTLTGILIGYLLVDGAFTIFSGIQGRNGPGWGWVIVSGIASIVLAILLWRQWPASGMFAVGLLVGIRLIFSGWSIAMLGVFGDAAVESVASDVARQEKAAG